MGFMASLLPVEQGVVHVYVEDLGAVFDLLTGHAQGFFVFVFPDQPGEFFWNR